MGGRALVAVVGAVVLVGCHHEAPEAEAAAGPKKVRCAEIVRQPVTDTVELRGTVAPLPDRDAMVSPQVPGRILKLLVREGDPVTAGQVLAEIDAAPLADQVAEAQAQLAKARAESQNARTTLARVQRVFEHGIAARQEVDDATAKAAAADAAQAEAESVAQRARRQLDRATVRSPLAGVVLKVMHHSGELVDGTPATAIAEVGDPSQLELVADAPAQDLVRLARGDVAVVTFAALPGRKLPGTVTTVAPAVDRTSGLGTVRLGLDLSGGVAPPVGIYGAAAITSGRPRDALVAPSVALRSAIGGEAEIVVCGADKLAHVKKIRRATVIGKVTEVQGEVNAGDKVAVDPVLGIADGDALEVAP